MFAWDPNGRLLNTIYGGYLAMGPSGHGFWRPGLYPPEGAVIPGRYTVRVYCTQRTPGKPNVVTYHKDAFFTVNGPMQQLIVSSTRVHLGATFGVKPLQACPTATTDLAVTAEQVVTGNVGARGFVATTDLTPTSAGKWSTGTFKVPADTPTGRYVVAAQCRTQLPGSGSQLATLGILDYETYDITVLP